jgi:hypothetical protein
MIKQERVGVNPMKENVSQKNKKIVDVNSALLSLGLLVRLLFNRHV